MSSDHHDEYPARRQLVAAVAAATRDIGTVGKSGRNSHDRYTYSSDEDFARAVQPVLAQHELMLVPTAMHDEWFEVKSRSGNSMRGCRLKVDWTLSHSGGGCERFQIISEGIDRGDKAAYKAMTGSRKYALRLCFQIPTSDDPEIDSPQPEPTPSTPFDKIRAKVRSAHSAGALTTNDGIELMGIVKEWSDSHRAAVWNEVAQANNSEVADLIRARAKGGE